MKKLHWLLLGAVTLVFLAINIGEFFFTEGEHPFYHFPGFWIVFGAAGCWLLIVFGKIVLGSVVYKKEDYYD